MRRSTIFIAFMVTAASLHAQSVPAVAIVDLKTGTTTTLDKAVGKGKVTLISFWATWCIPGKQEIKTIIHHMPAWKKLLDFNYIAIAVDQQQTETQAFSFVKKQHWNFPAYMDANSELKRALNFNGLPHILLVNEKGKIVFAYNGNDDGKIIAAQLKQMAAQRRR